MSGINLVGAVGGYNFGVDEIVWTFEGHLRVGAYHDLIAGAEPTLANPHSFLEIFETSDFTRVTFRLASLTEKCGRYQFDVEREAGDSGADVLLDFGHDCGIIITPPTFYQAQVPESSTLQLTLFAALVYSAYRTWRRP